MGAYKTKTMIYLQIFIWYYPISTGIVLYSYLTNVDHLKKEFPMLFMLPEYIMLLSILFTGWLVCPLTLHTFYLDWRIKRLKMQNKELEENIAKIDNEIYNFKKTRTPEIEK